MTLPDNYDPSPSAKVWYRHILDGQLGWFVKRNGMPKIKLDRTGREILKPFNKHDWNPCEERRKLTPYHLGEITFEADKVLCRILGKYDISHKIWQNLRQDERVKWIDNGPDDEPMRIKLYQLIKDSMGDYSEKNSREIDPE